MPPVAIRRRAGGLRIQGAAPWPERTSDSKLLYYSRHYRFRGDPLPYASILGGPRGDLGYLAYAVFIGDNQTFCLCIMAPSWEQDWRALREPAAFERVARELPGMAPGWMPLNRSAPSCRWASCGTRCGRRASTARRSFTGLVPIGDARCPYQSDLRLRPVALARSRERVGRGRRTRQGTTSTSRAGSSNPSVPMRRSVTRRSPPRTQTASGCGRASPSTRPIAPTPCRCSYGRSSIAWRRRTPQCSARCADASTSSTQSMRSPRNQELLDRAETALQRDPTGQRTAATRNDAGRPARHHSVAAAPDTRRRRNAARSARLYPDWRHVGPYGVRWGDLAGRSSGTPCRGHRRRSTGNS